MGLFIGLDKEDIEEQGPFTLGLIFYSSEVVDQISLAVPWKGPLAKGV